MQQDHPSGFRAGSGRQPEPIGCQDLSKSAPTEPEAFLRWGLELRREEGKPELSRGRLVHNMSCVSSLHSRVVRILLGRLDRLLDPDRLEIGISDHAVRTPPRVRSPDVVGEHAKPRPALSTSTPLCIAELSASTAKTDLMEKVEACTAIALLQTCLICSQDEPRAWRWARQTDASWPKPPVELAGRDGGIAPGGPGVDLTMAAISAASLMLQRSSSSC